ncbi:MAG: hypothetical protein L0H73_13135 [Nitrococcus sp.]|nr:hypothetical protein [Nitrococcus sp.]
MPHKYIRPMDLSPEDRSRLQRNGRAGGLTRASRMAAPARRAVARRAGTARWIRTRFGAARFGELALPGGEMIDAGLADLASGKSTAESLAVSLAAARLRREGVPLGAIESDAEDRLYDLLCANGAGLAHARYGAYLRQLASFADACPIARVDRK